MQADGHMLATLAVSYLAGIAVSSALSIIHYSSHDHRWLFGGGHDWPAFIGVWLLCYPLAGFALLLLRFHR